ncbi:MAG: hypothetical protein ACNA8W_26515, partial [Bradymonadaceae bacterium]
SNGFTMKLAVLKYFKMLLRPWKVVTFLIGTAYFVIGAGWYALPTWDVGVSIWMSVLCYGLAPLGVSMAVTGYRDFRGLHRVAYILGSAMIIYFVGSGSYELYHRVFFDGHPPTYWQNLFYSVPVTIIAGILWRYDGTLREMWTEIRDVRNQPRDE